MIPITHGIVEAARELADGGSLASVADLLLAEIAIGGIYVIVGVGLLRLFEFEARRTATLETF